MGVPTCRDPPPTARNAPKRADSRRNAPIRSDSLRFAPIGADSRRFGRNHFSAKPCAIGPYRFCRLGRRFSDLRVFDCQRTKERGAHQLPSPYLQVKTTFARANVYFSPQRRRGRREIRDGKEKSKRRMKKNLFFRPTRAAARTFARAQT